MGTVVKVVVVIVLMDINQKTKISISWSGGKDSALALYRILQSGQFDVVGLHTVFNAENKRVGMHGIHEELIQKQADLLNIPLHRLYLDADKTTRAYEKLMIEFYKRLRVEGVKYVMFGDIFLEDLKDFRDSMLDQAHLIGVYPLWQKDTEYLFREFLNLDFKSILCAGDATKIPKAHMGKPLSRELLSLAIDPCGENGEYHSFVTSGPLFDGSILVQGARVKSKEYQFETLNENGKKEKHSNRFWFADLQLA